MGQAEQTRTNMEAWKGKSLTLYMKSEFRHFSCLLPSTRGPPLVKSTLEGQTRVEEHGNNSKIVRKSYIGKTLEREGRITITTPCGCLLRCKRTSLAVALSSRAQKCAADAAAWNSGMEREASKLLPPLSHFLEDANEE